MMYQGTRTVKRQMNTIQKYLLLGSVLALALAISIGFTISFLAARGNSIINTFIPGKVSCQINETVSDGVKSSVTVTNTGNVPAYVRVAVVANVTEDGYIVPGRAAVNFKLGSDWKLNNEDGYYYYTSAVEPNAPTTDLLGGSINLSGIQVTILAEAIQAEGVTGSTKAVVDAWGVDPVSLGTN